MQTDSHDESLRQSSENRRWRFPIILSAWLMLIFGTSCTVIRPLEFFRLLQNFTGADRASMERFGVFWGISWFAIVKGWHFTEFAILAFLCVGVIKWWRGFVDSWSIFGAMVFCFAFAASDEFHQSFVPDRFGTIQDVLIDSLGVCVAICFIPMQSLQCVFGLHSLLLLVSQQRRENTSVFFWIASEEHSIANKRRTKHCRCVLEMVCRQAGVIPA